MRRTLEYQADQIEMVLYTHKVPGRVLGGVVTPRWVRFEVMLALGAKVSSMVRLSEEIALRLGSGGVRVRRQGSTVRVEVPREDGEVVRLLRLAARLGEIPRQAAVLGLDEEGVPLLLRLPSPEVGHVWVAGTTGSGKTALVRSMVMSLALHNRQGEVQLVVIDPKGRGYEALSGLPHLMCPVVREVGEASYVLSELVRMMLERDREGVREPRVVVAIDEMADLVQAGGGGVGRSITRLTEYAEADGRGDRQPGEEQLSGAAGGECGECGGCEGGQWAAGDGSGEADGAGGLCAGGERGGNPLSGGVCE
jgi:S-DNA-T family DNA segregation ATPase FtsK/SpoIIIE